MIKDFYPLPIPFKDIIERKEIKKCNIQTSIAQKLHIILVTAFDECRYNSQFGCIVWEYDFENIFNLNGWKDLVTKSIIETIRENEKRLKNIQVNISVNQEMSGEEKTVQKIAIRKRLDIEVKGNLQKTNELFVFSESIYVSPLALD